MAAARQLLSGSTSRPTCDIVARDAVQAGRRARDDPRRFLRSFLRALRKFTRRGFRERACFNWLFQDAVRADDSPSPTPFSATSAPIS